MKQTSLVLVFLLGACASPVDLHRAELEMYFAENPMDSVQILCNKALDLDLNLADAYVLRGRYHQYVEGFKNNAKNDLLNALTIDPNNSQAYTFLGNWNWQEQDFPEALRNYNRASKLVRGKDRILLNVNMAYFYLTLWDYEKAKELLNNTIKLEPDNIGAWSGLAHINRCLGQWKKNLPIAEKIVSMDHSGAFASDVGMIYMMNGNYTESEKFFEKYHSLSPDKLTLFSYDDLHMFAYVLMKNGKPADSAFQQPYTEAELAKVERMLS